MKHLLDTLPSPARGGTGRGHLCTSQTSTAPCSPPAHSPVKISAPPPPPPPSWSSAPPPIHPAPVYQPPAYQAPASTYGALGTQWQAPRTAVPVLPERVFPSYREKLRAGGRGAFQRANHAGLGKSVTEEWDMAQMTPTAAQGQGIPAHRPKDQYNISMQYAGNGDSNLMWNSGGQMQSNACWSAPMDPPQMTPQYSYAPQLQQAMLPQDLRQISPTAGQQSPQAFLQQSQMPLLLPEMAGQTPQVQQHMPMAQTMPAEQLQTELSQMPSSTSGSGTCTNVFSMPQVAPSLRSGSGGPADIDRCMAIVMPGAGYSHVTAGLVAAQLKAMAEIQGCYED